MTKRRPLTPRRLAPGELPAVKAIEAAGTVAELVDVELALAVWSARRNDYADVWAVTSPLASALTRRLVELADAERRVVDQVRALDGGPEVPRRGPFGSRPCAAVRHGKPDPGSPKVEAVKAKQAELSRKRDVTAKAAADTRGELVAQVNDALPTS